MENADWKLRLRDTTRPTLLPSSTITSYLYRERSISIRASACCNIASDKPPADKNLPLYDARTMLEHMDLPLAPARAAATALGGFGALALLLAAVGVFGVMSHAVTQRRREIGVRIALGAGSKKIFKLIVGQGALLVGTGVGIGLGGAVLGTRLLASFLFGVSALDPLTFVGVTALLTATAFLACYLPVRRATKVDPMVALRQE
jgi:putative ABC transport system permease protein